MAMNFGWSGSTSTRPIQESMNDSIKSSFPKTRNVARRRAGQRDVRRHPTDDVGSFMAQGIPWL